MFPLIACRFKPSISEKIKKSLRSHATTNPSEFVAEYFSQVPFLKKEGKEIPSELTELYKRFKGPELIEF